MITSILSLFSLLLLYKLLVKLIIPILKFYLRKKDYAHLYQTTKTILDLVGTDHNAKLTEFFDSMIDENGDVRNVVTLGANLDGSPYVGVSDVEMVKEVLYKLDLPKYQPEYDVLTVFLGKGLVAESGEKWKNRRKLITPLFHFESLKEYVIPIERELGELKRALFELDGEFIEGKDIFADFAMKVIVDLAFGNEFDASSVAEKFTEVNQRFNNYSLFWLILGNLANYIPGKYTKGTNDLILSIQDDVITAIKHRNSSPTSSNDLINMLINGVDENGDPISAVDIVSECKTFLFAGSDTTSSTMSWVMYHIARNPDVQYKLREKIERVLGDREPSYEDLANLSYVKNVIRETLRVTPVVPFLDRYTSKEIILGGVRIPKDTCIGLFFHNTHRDPKYWNEPERFNPDRWESEKPVPFLYTPFSAGSRNCIGEKFAMNEMILLLTMISRNFDVEIESDKVTPIFEGVVIPYGLKVRYLPLGK